MLRTLSFLLLVSTFNVAFACTVADSRRPLTVAADEAKALFYQRNFKELEKLTKQYRSEREVLSDGQPKLGALYSGIIRPYKTEKTLADCVKDNTTEQDWAEHSRLLTEWHKAFPKSYVPKLVSASLTIREGWHARGNGYTATVTKDGWNIFKEKIERGRVMLEALKGEARNDPQWYASMLSVGMGQGWNAKKYNALYKQAVKKFPYYFPFDFAASSYYSPEWNGSQQQLASVVDAAVKRTEKKLGQTLYARLYWSNWTKDMFRTSVEWDRMKLGFKRLLTDYPDPWNRNNFARFACLANDAETLKEQMRLIGKDVILEAWGDEALFNQCKKHAFSSSALDTKMQLAAAVM